MRIKTIGLGLSVIFLTFNVGLGQSFNDILREVSVTEGTDCYSNAGNCGSCTSQTCGETCRGRIRYPTMHVLSSTSYHFSYCVQSKSLPSYPPSAENDTSRQFTFQTSRTCFQQLNVKNAATVSFWITGSCSPACEFMTVGTSTQEFKWSLDDRHLKVTNISPSLDSQTSQSWIHIVFRVIKVNGAITLGLFVNGASKSVSSSSQISDVSMVKFGPEKGFRSGDSVSFLDVRVYEDFLTDGEIESLYNSKSQPEDTFCRCPISKPDNCQSASGDQSQYQGDNSTFYDIKAVFDDNSTTVWAASSDVTLQLQLYDVYKVTKVNIASEGSQSLNAKVEIDSTEHNCNGATENITCTIPSVSTKSITLKLSTSTTSKILISDITVSGECDCNGNGQCTRSKHYQTYTCGCSVSTNRSGDKCEACLPGYDINQNCAQCTANKKPGTKCKECSENYYASYAECSACRCTVNSTERCDNTTGECICKQGVTGEYCNECQDDYYGFDLRSDVVCKECNCNPVGSKNLICNGLGNCYCKDEFTDKYCTPRGEISPSYGPMSGGTTISINGTNFGSNPRVQLDGKIQNANVSDNGNMIQFMAAPAAANKLGPVNVMVSWNINGINMNFTYTYKQDPSVDTPRSTNLTILRGCKMRYTGKNFNSVNQPRLEFKTSPNKYSICTKTSNEKMECVVPQLDENTMETYLNLDCPNCGVSQNVTIASDPKVNGKLDVDFTYPFDKKFTITGTQFGVCDEDDIKVLIGEIECDIVITDTVITCKPPENRPRKDKIVYDITVKIGETFTLDAGKITYNEFINSSYFVYIMIGIVAFVLIAIALFIIICCRRKKKHKDMPMSISAPGQQSTPNSYTEMQKSKIDIIRPPTSGIENSAFNSEKESFEEIKKKFVQKLPHGLRPEVGSCIVNENEFSFGRICTAKGDKARFIDGKLTKGTTISQIMIKSIKKPFQDDDEYPEWVFKALTECIRFRNLSNPNILSIIGIGLEKHKFHILYPYMKNRSLKYFISDEKREFSLKQLLGYGVQISEGMCFLNDHNIVHEDLATRNCMVNQDSLIKISDSAFSHDFYPTEYMLDLSKNRYLPIRWMAPESIKFGFYDIKSDVWSYGVLLWELLTRGCLPFIDTNDTGVYDLIAQGYRLGKPEIISDEIYDLINKCWEEESEFRPSFTIIRDTLSSLMVGDVAGQEDLYINWTEPRESIYMNSESFKRKSEKNNSESYYGNL